MDLNTMTGGELAVEYNRAAAILGRDRVKRFGDKKSALRRTKNIMREAKSSPKQAAKHIKRKPGGKRKLRGMRFVFPFDGAENIRECRGSLVSSKSGDERTLRQRCVDLLKKGSTFDKVETLVVDFDKDRGKKSEFVERRAYELVRLMHYYLGYGLRQDDKGRIFLVSSKR